MALPTVIAGRLFGQRRLERGEPYFGLVNLICQKMLMEAAHRSGVHQGA
jgi:hypothetical protein